MEQPSQEIADATPIVIDGLWLQNPGWLETPEGGIITGLLGRKIGGGRFGWASVDHALRPTSGVRVVQTEFDSIHDVRPFHYPTGETGILAATQTGWKQKQRSRERRTWGQGIATWAIGATSVGEANIFPGDPGTLGHKNFIATPSGIITHPGRNEFMRWGETTPVNLGWPLPIELRGGSNIVWFDDDAHGLCSYHVVHKGVSGRKRYDAYLGIVSKSWPHICLAWWWLDCSKVLALHPEVLNAAYHLVESVVFPMGLRRVCDDFEIISGVQDGAAYGLLIDGAEVNDRLIALREQTAFVG